MVAKIRWNLNRYLLGMNTIIEEKFVAGARPVRSNTRATERYAISLANRLDVH